LILTDGNFSMTPITITDSFASSRPDDRFGDVVEYCSIVPHSILFAAKPNRRKSRFAGTNKSAATAGSAQSRAA